MSKDYKKDVSIDPDALDVEWVKQSELMFEYSERAAIAKDNLGRLEERLEVLEARLSLDIRKDPAKYGLEKSATEKAIAALILLSKKRRELAKEIADAKFELDIINSAVRSLDMKKSALQDLVRLHTQSYYADPRPPSEGGREFVKRSIRKIARNKAKHKHSEDDDE